MYNEYMGRAMEIAERGVGWVAPNPLVGAVIVKDGRVIGEGYHKKYGDKHAEIDAIEHSTESVAGATIYVTLEPCSHYGKTPPCVERIIREQFKTVVIGMLDPNPLVDSVKLMCQHGIEVVTGVMEQEVMKQNGVFIKYITTEYPYCVLKKAISLDGKMCTNTGDGSWFTSDSSRERVHQMRHRYSGIMVGVNTVINDDPQLTTRIPNGKNSVRIVCDTHGRTPLESKILNDGGRTIIASAQYHDKYVAKGAEVLVVPVEDGRLCLKTLMRELHKMKIDSILVEGGQTLHDSLIACGLVDKFITFVAPRLIGSIERMRDTTGLQSLEIAQTGDDFVIEGALVAP